MKISDELKKRMQKSKQTRQLREARFLNLAPIRWLTGQPYVQDTPDTAARLSVAAESGLCRIFCFLHLEHLMEGSIFLHPMLWCILTLLLLPFLPTMVMLVLSAVTILSVILTKLMQRSRGAEDGKLRYRTRLYSPGLRLVGLLAAVYLLSVLCSVSPKDSLYPALLMAFFMLFAFGTYGSAGAWSDVRRAFAVIGFAAVLVSLYGIWQYLNPDAYNTGWLDEDMFSTIRIRVYSTFQNPNVLGEYLLLTAPAAFALMLTAANTRKRAAWGAALLLILLCAVLTWSRGCYIGLAVAAVVFLVLLDRRFLIPVLILLLLSPLYLPDAVWSRILSIGNLGDTSTNYRMNIWIGVIDMLKDFWYCGIGPGEGAFNTVYPLYALEAIDAPHSHCLYLQLLCDTGISGLLVFLGFACSLLRSLCGTIRHAGRRETRIFAIAGLSAFCGFLLQSFTDYSFYNYRVLLLFFGMAGLCLVLRHEEVLLRGDGKAGELAAENETEDARPLVLQILSDSNLGGAGRYLLNLFSAYDADSWRMVLVLPDGGVVAEQAEALGIPVIRADMPGERSLDWKSLLELRRICMLVRPDVVQTHGSLSGRIAARACSARIVYTRHSVFPVSERLQHGPGHLLSAWMNRRYGDVALAVSPAAEENLRQIGVEQSRIVTVMNGARALQADAEKQKCVRAQYQLKQDVFTAGIFARLEEYKGHDTLLDAVRILKQEGLQLRVLICGTGPQEEHLKEKIRRTGLEDTVTMAGFLTDVAPVLSCMNAQLNASTGTEATSLALIEGMSLGLPTIASSYGGNPWLIHDGVEGLLFAPGDAEAMAACMRQLIHDPELCRRLGQQAKASYEADYTAAAFAEKLQNVWRKAMNRGRKSA